MPFFYHNSAKHFYTLQGNGPALILLHGFTGSSANWTPLANALSSNFTVLTIDILGHGRSTAPPNPDRYRIEHVAADLIALLNLLVIERAHLLGYSMGGRLALYTAVHHPDRVRTLILESSSPGLKTAVERSKRAEQDNALADWIEAHGIEAFVDRWEQHPLWASQDQVNPKKRAALRAQRLQNGPTGLANSLRGMGTGAQPSLWDQLTSLTLPSLQIVGALDKKFVAINLEMNAALPNSQLVTVPEAGHTVHFERPSAYKTAVVKFLNNS